MSNIEWTDITDNPIHLRNEDGSHGGHWCKKKSPGCANCYAEKINQSGFFKFASHLPYSGQAPPSLYFDFKVIDRWTRILQPKKHFVCSMTDWAGEWVPRQWQIAILDAAQSAPLQTIQLLTKRPDVALDVADRWRRRRHKTHLPDNVWMGVSVEDQARADERRRDWEDMADLCKITWVSYEPALEVVDWDGWQFIKWMVIGGESGPGARQFDLRAGRRAIAYCRQHNIAPYMKQMGSNPVMNVYDWHDWCEEDGWDRDDAQLIGWEYDWGQPPLDTLCSVPFRKKGGNPDEWPKDMQVREFPSLEVAA